MKKRYRESRGHEKILLDRKKDRDGKRERKIGQTEEEKQSERDAAKVAKQKYRAKILNAELETKEIYDEKEANRKRIRDIRAEQMK